MSLKTYINPESISEKSIERKHISDSLLASVDNMGIVQLYDYIESEDITKAPTSRALGEVYKFTKDINESINSFNIIRPEIGAVYYNQNDRTYYIDSAQKRSVYIKISGRFKLRINDLYYIYKCYKIDNNGFIINFYEYEVDTTKKIEFYNDDNVTYIIEISRLSNTNIIEKDLDEIIESISLGTIIWDDNHNLNNYITTGDYHIIGNKSNVNDNIPILNNGQINARLNVIADAYSDTATQILTLLNKDAGEGNVYIRTIQNGVWKPWGKLQSNIEVGLINEDQMKDLLDNGMYSGILEETGETFVLVVLNNYAIATIAGYGGYKSQLLYSIDLGGNVNIKTRRVDAYGIWSEWKGVNDNDIQEICYDGANGGRDLVIEIEPNKYYNIKHVSSLWVSFKQDTNSNKLKNYMFEFTFRGGNSLRIDGIENIKWANGNAPTNFIEGITYQISIINNLGVFTEFK